MIIWGVEGMNTDFLPVMAENTGIEAHL
jgi:hypothetical protein